MEATTTERTPLSNGEARKLFDALSHAEFKATLTTDPGVTIQLGGLDAFGLARLIGIVRDFERDLKCSGFLPEAEIV